MIKFSILLIALTLVCSSNVPTESNDIASCIAAITVLPKDIMSVIEAVKEFVYLDKGSLSIYCKNYYSCNCSC